MTTCQESINNHMDCRTVLNPGAPAWLVRLLARFAEWHQRALRRHELAELLDKPDHLLRDMGIRREDVLQEYRKPFWLD